MNRFLLKNLFVMTVFAFTFTMQAVTKKPWTFLVYLAAANDLNPFALFDLHEMMSVGSNDNVNIVVYLTLQEDGQQKETKKLYVNKGSLTQIGEIMDRDSGDVSTLVEALQWAHDDYPSDHVAVVMWDHGSGPLNRSTMVQPARGVCYDFDTGHYLTDRDCLHAFSWARHNLRNGKKYDIIAFDACLLASLEMACVLEPCADYMIASQETIPGDGYQYAYILNQFSTKKIDPLAFAQHMVRAYRQEYNGSLDYTLSATDLNSLNFLVDNCNAVATFLDFQLQGKNEKAVKKTIKKCISSKKCPSFDQGIYIDLCQFYTNLLKDISKLKLSKSDTNQCKQMLKTGIQLFSVIIKENVVSKNHKNARGLSIYFPQGDIDFSYYNLYWTEKNPSWLGFLKAYLM